jgi:aspartate-semialdehyde dehydrogenase
MHNSGGLKAVVFGATGAVGKTLVAQLNQSDVWQKVLVVVRKELPEWSQLKNANKLVIHIE